MLSNRASRAMRRRTLRATFATDLGRTGSHIPVNLKGDAQGILVMEDGSVHTGYSFGANRSIAGEVVFTTNMVGYVRSLAFVHTYTIFKTKRLLHCTDTLNQ